VNTFAMNAAALDGSAVTSTAGALTPGLLAPVFRGDGPPAAEDLYPGLEPVPTAHAE
jgi:hypothetical protein